MLKMIAFVLFVLCGAVGGFTLSEKLRIRRDSCRAVCEMLHRISMLIRYRKMDMFEIIRELKSCKEYSNLHFLSELPDYYEPCDDFHKLWENAVQSDRNLETEERNCLVSFGHALGKSDIEGQLLSIDGTCEIIKDIQQRCNEEYLRKSKLYKSVGVLLGTMTGIMII